jgi:hypothetical protein
VIHYPKEFPKINPSGAITNTKANLSKSEVTNSSTLWSSDNQGVVGKIP